jgi:hypothetical protein
VGRECRCGCGAMVDGPAHKKFVDDAHRQRAGRVRRRWWTRRRGRDDDAPPRSTNPSRDWCAEPSRTVAEKAIPNPAADAPDWFDDNAPGWTAWP